MFNFYSLYEEIINLFILTLNYLYIIYKENRQLLNMDIKEIDIELNVKMKEVFKKALKDKNVEIIFETPEYNTLESIVVKSKGHIFTIKTSVEKYDTDGVNSNYFPILSNKMKKILSNDTISQDDKIKKIKRKFWWSFIFNKSKGKLIETTKYENITYLMSYNAVIIALTKKEYLRLVYYSKYVYKLRQLHHLNDELGISQDFNIIFDDDMIAKQMHDELYDTFKDIIEPFNNKDNKDDED